MMSLHGENDFDHDTHRRIDDDDVSRRPFSDIRMVCDGGVMVSMDFFCPQTSFLFSDHRQDKDGQTRDDSKYHYNRHLI